MTPEALEVLRDQIRERLDRIIGKVGIAPLEETGGEILGLGVYLLVLDHETSRDNAIRCFAGLYDKAVRMTGAMAEIELQRRKEAGD